MNKPFIFIGSSSEHLDVAEAVKAVLEYSSECQVWTQGLFDLTHSTLESLTSKLKDFDFAILILTPDDITVSRGTKKYSPRDNVLFELGLFMGALGRNNVFIVMDREAKIKLPSDLDGLTLATYSKPNKGNWQTALGTACSAINDQIKKTLGSKKKEDNISHIDLANLQRGKNLKNVWVYAPLPWEEIDSDGGDILAYQVFENLFSGIKYTYFVESSEGIERITDLIKKLAKKFSKKNYASTLNTLLLNTSVVVLKPSMFLTHFTLHLFNGGITDVYQSKMTFNREDLLFKLDSYHSRKVYELICQEIKINKPISIAF